MTAKRLTKEDIRTSTGILVRSAWRPRLQGRCVVTAEAVASLRAAGSARRTSSFYRAEKSHARLRERVRTASEAAGFSTKSP